MSCTPLHSKVFTIGRVSPTCFCVFCFFQLVIAHDHLPPQIWKEIIFWNWIFASLAFFGGFPAALMLPQVLAIDQDFGLFHRAWCVAELAEAKLLQMHQQVPWDSQVAGRTIDLKYFEHVYTNIVYVEYIDMWHMWYVLYICNYTDIIVSIYINMRFASWV